MFIPEIQNNSLKPQLEEVVYIAQRLEAETDELSTKFIFNSPATEEEILKLENFLRCSIPIGYKEFMTFSNGARLCGRVARFGDIDAVINMNEDEFDSDFPSDYVVIANIIGDGEILCFSKKTGKFIRYFDGREIIFSDFYVAFNEIISIIKHKAEDYVEL